MKEKIKKKQININKKLLNFIFTITEDISQLELSIETISLKIYDEIKVIITNK